MSAPVYNAAFSVAYALDPYYSKRDETAATPTFTAPKLSAQHMEKLQSAPIFSTTTVPMLR
jgi:hypothetical protein